MFHTLSGILYDHFVFLICRFGIRYSLPLIRIGSELSTTVGSERQTCQIFSHPLNRQIPPLDSTLSELMLSVHTVKQINAHLIE